MTTQLSRIAAALLTICLALPAWAQDGREGYYYPKVTTTEVFERVVRQGPPAAKAVRIEFINSLTAAQMQSPAQPAFAVFAKGSDAKHLIITGLDDDTFETLYRARAVMAQLTVNVRRGGFFQIEGLQYVATFYDFLQLLQFDTLVLTNGRDWAHMVEFKRN